MRLIFNNPYTKMNTNPITHSDRIEEFITFFKEHWTDDGKGNEFFIETLRNEFNSIYAQGREDAVAMTRKEIESKIDHSPMIVNLNGEEYIPLEYALSASTNQTGK